MAEKKKGSITIVYEEAPSRPIIPVGGAYGGPTPDGASVVAHVYAEYVTIPAIQEHQVDERGRVDLGVGKPIKRADVTRLVQASLVLSPEASITIGNWLVEKGNNALQQRAKQREEQRP
jgi:hypothetical protein